MFKILKRCIGVSLAVAMLTGSVGVIPVGAAANPQLDASSPEALEASIDQIVNALTIEQKANMLVGAGGINGRSGAASATYEMLEYGVPRSTFVDGPVGVARYGKVTAFPGLNVMAATWDTDLIEQVGAAMGTEARHYGMDSILGPGIEIQRNPLGGRNADYFSEDPILSGMMAAAYTNGLQSEDCLADLKHFAANVAETLRERNDSIMTERTLRETYLRNYELAIKLSNPGSIMTTYNLINNKFATADKELLTGIVRDEWGYDGLIITDWFVGDGASYTNGGMDLFKYEFDYDTIEQIEAGVNMLMPGGSEGNVPIDRRKEIREWAQQSDENMQQVNKLCKEILRYVSRTATFKGTIMNNEIDYEANAAVARQAAADGIVLLKNEKALPIQNDTEVALYGKAQYDEDLTGGGSAAITIGNYNTYTTIHDGFTKAGIPLNETVVDAFSGREATVTATAADSAAAKSDVAIYVVKKTGAEWTDRTPDTGEYGYYLDAQIIKNIKTISKAFRARGKKLVVVIKSVGPIDTEQWGEYADAIVYAGVGGTETGTALVDMLTGAVNPSGKLAQTFPKNYNQVPGAAEFPGEYFSSGFVYNSNHDYRETHMEEGIYVGYKYFSTFNKETSYPFGHGLSYTDFTYGNATVGGTSAYDSKKAAVAYGGGDLTFTIDVTNTGSVAGREAVQLYVTNKGTALETPEIELKTFAKTKLLQPGETETLTLRVNEELLKYYDEEQAAWIIPAGDYEARFGASSEDIREYACYTVDEQILVQQVSNKCVLPETEELDEYTVAEDGGKTVAVATNGQWKYVAQAPENFADPSYDDSSWEIKQGPFGSEKQDGVDAVLTPITGTGYFRTTLSPIENLCGIIIEGTGTEDTKVFVNGELLSAGAEIQGSLGVAAAPVTVAVQSSGFAATVYAVTGITGEAAALQAVMATANEKLQNKDAYLLSSTVKLEAAYQDAEALLENEFYTQAEVDSAITLLNAAMAELKEKGDVRSAYEQIAGISYDDGSSNVARESDNSSVGWISSGSWLAYAAVDFGSLGAQSLTLETGSNPATENPRVALVLDSREENAPIITCQLQETADWKDFKKATFTLDQPITGVHDVYFIFYSDQNSVCNFASWQFTEATLADTTELETKVQQLQAKYDGLEEDTNPSYKAHLADIIYTITEAIAANAVTEFQNTAYIAQIEEAMEPAYQLNFLMNLLKNSDLRGYEAEGAYQVSALLMTAYNEQKNGTLTADAATVLANQLGDAIGALSPLPGYPYNAINAFSGSAVAGSEQPTNSDGYLGVQNGFITMDYGEFDFGSFSSPGLQFHYRNVNNDTLKISIYEGSPNGNLLGTINLGQTDEKGADATVYLNELLSGTKHIYFAINSAGGHAGYDSFRFLQNNDIAVLQSSLAAAQEVDAALYTENSYKQLEKAMEQAEDVLYVSSYSMNSALVNAASEVLQYAMTSLVATGDKNPYQTVNASSADILSGPVHRVEDGVDNIGSIKSGAYLAFNGLKFGEKGADSCEIYISSPSDNVAIEVRLDSETGTLVGETTLPNTGAWNVYRPATISFTQNITGAANLYFVIKSSQSGDVCNITTITFREATTAGISFRDNASAQHIKALVEGLQITEFGQKPLFDLAKDLYASLTPGAISLLGADYEALGSRLDGMESAITEQMTIAAKDLKAVYTVNGAPATSLTDGILHIDLFGCLIDDAYLLENSYTVITALYDDTKLVKAVSGNHAQLEITDVKEGYQVKTFIWNNTHMLNPLTIAQTL